MSRDGVTAAKDLVDEAPGLVLPQVTSDRAARAREFLEGVGAAVLIR
jgi:ribosomal protein L7/L12